MPTVPLRVFRDIGSDSVGLGLRAREASGCLRVCQKDIKAGPSLYTSSSFHYSICRAKHERASKGQGRDVRGR
jgi:hypothetical protein